MVSNQMPYNIIYGRRLDASKMLKFYLANKTADQKPTSEYIERYIDHIEFSGDSLCLHHKDKSGRYNTDYIWLYNIWKDVIDLIKSKFDTEGIRFQTSCDSECDPVSWLNILPSDHPYDRDELIKFVSENKETAQRAVILANAFAFSYSGTVIDDDNDFEVELLVNGTGGYSPRLVYGCQLDKTKMLKFYLENKTPDQTPTSDYIEHHTDHVEAIRSSIELHLKDKTTKYIWIGKIYEDVIDVIKSKFDTRGVKFQIWSDAAEVNYWLNILPSDDSCYIDDLKENKENKENKATEARALIIARAFATEDIDKLMISGTLWTHRGEDDSD
jgi:hypothetical protein